MFGCQALFTLCSFAREAVFVQVDSVELYRRIAGGRELRGFGCGALGWGTGDRRLVVGFERGCGGGTRAGGPCFRIAGIGRRGGIVRIGRGWRWCRGYG